MRSFLLRGMAICALCVGMLCLGATAAFGAEVTVKPKAGTDAYSVIQAELYKADTLGTESDPYVVTVAPGSYKLAYALNIHSNTKLVLTGVKFTSASSSANMIKVGAQGVDTKKGYYYQNIEIVGGDFNNNGHSSSGIVIGHSKNVTLRNMKVHNAKNGHLLEVAGTDGFTVENCSFYDQVQTANAKVSTPEAIQIDIHVEKHMKTYRSEALPMKNIVIKNCTFKNVPRGVGSHTAILNDWVENVEISNNTFTNCKSGAIQVLHYKNCTIENNTIDGAPRGIIVFTVNTKGVFLASTAVKEGKVPSKVSNSYQKPDKNQNIVIRNNTVTLKGSDIYAESENEGIMVSGFKFTSALKKSSATDAIPKGDYYASGVTIEDNVIKTTGHGIRLSDARNSVVKNNKITYVKGGKSKDFYGVQLINASTNNVIEGNTIKARTNGIFVTTKSSAKAIENNVVTSAGKYGIALEKGSATTIKGNTVKKAVMNGIYLLRGAKATTITKNTITKVTKGSGINIDANSTAKNITSNTVKNVKLSGIFVHKSSKATTVSKNKILKAGKYGIFVEMKGKVSKITDNTIKLKKDKAIVVRSGKSKQSGNKVK